MMTVSKRGAPNIQTGMRGQTSSNGYLLMSSLMVVGQAQALHGKTSPTQSAFPKLSIGFRAVLLVISTMSTLSFIDRCIILLNG